MMGNFISYKDVPVFADFMHEDFSPVASVGSYMFASSDASIAFDPILTPNRFLGRTQIRNDFSATGPLATKVSFTFYPLIEQTNNSILNIQKPNQLAFFNLTGNFSKGHRLQISNLILKNCFLQSYSMKINPNQPISVTANFISYNSTTLAGTGITDYKYLIPSIPKDTSTAYYEGLHALTTSMDGSAVNLPVTKTSIDINIDCQRTPVYALGQEIPDSVILTAVERVTSINGENIGSIVGLTGANAGSTNIFFLPLSQKGNQANASNNVLSFDINGRITSQQISVAANSLMNGKVVIKEVIL